MLSQLSLISFLSSFEALLKLSLNFFSLFFPSLSLSLSLTHTHNFEQKDHYLTKRE